MSKEKYIKGKKDECHHDGKYSNTKREQEADYHLLAYLSGDFDTDTDYPDDDTDRPYTTRPSTSNQHTQS